MRTLIAISSCEYFETSGLNSPARETYLPEAVILGFDYKFFHGRGATPKNDVVVLDVVDELYGLTEKAKAKLCWAINQGYTHVFSCFPDTYVCPERLLSCGYENYDYFGNVHQFPGSAPFCQGGPGYFLSRKSCYLVGSSPYSYLNDDTFIGDILDRPDIRREDCRNFTAFGPGPIRDQNNTITNHLSTQPGGYTGWNMMEEHRRWLNS